MSLFFQNNTIISNKRRTIATSKATEVLNLTPSDDQNTLFSNSAKIVNINKTVTRIVTKTVTEDIKSINLLYDNLYNDIGTDITNILNSFVTGSEDLTTLIDYESYSNLSQKFHNHLHLTNENFELFRKLLMDSIEGVKHSNNRILEQEAAYTKLLRAYNLLIEPNKSSVILDMSIETPLAAQVKPEVLEYIRRGNKIVDEDGKLIPIDMDILGDILNEMNSSN